jgi:hypothetical protein
MFAFIWHINAREMCCKHTGLLNRRQVGSAGGSVPHFISVTWVYLRSVKLQQSFAVLVFRKLALCIRRRSSRLLTSKRNHLGDRLLYRTFFLEQ